MIHTGDHQHIQPLARTGPSADEVAATILDGFNRHYALFRYGAQRAKALFESGDWRGIQQLSRERIEYYDMRVRDCSAALAAALRGSRFGMDRAAKTGDARVPGAGRPALAALTEGRKRYWRLVSKASVDRRGGP